MNSLLSSDTVALRALEPTDLDTLYRWENDANLWAVTETIAPYSRQMLWAYLKEYTEDIYQSRQLRLMAILPDGAAIGTADLYHFDPLNNRAEMGLYVAPEFRQHGYAKEILRLLCQYAAQHIGMKQLYAYIRTDNTACIRLYEDYGFKQAGLLQCWVKRGQCYHDAALMQLILG